MIRVSIIGSGNLAQHLIQAFYGSKSIELVQVFARNQANFLYFIDSNKVISDLKLLENSDVYIIAVSDDAILDVSNQLIFNNKLVVHTSGSANSAILNSKNRKGSFYPLQTFSKNKAVDFKCIPICLEAENEIDYELLSKVAHSISDKIFKINSDQRKAIHVSAVFVCNFVNYLYGIANKICAENGIPFEILYPLIQETAQKLMVMSPNEAQTGPAIRGDMSTIASHLIFLNDENQKHIYSILTQSIAENGKEL